MNEALHSDRDRVVQVANYQPDRWKGPANRLIPGQVACRNLTRGPIEMAWRPVFAISVGASSGALLRWQLGVRLNSFFPVLPPGTLAANLAGGYIIGLAIAYLSQAPYLAPEWRLLIVTGFCGGLTTFSTFSAEVVTLLQEGRFVWAAAEIAVHILGSLLMTIAGLATWQVIESL
jgi:fluoride exporter